MNWLKKHLRGNQPLEKAALVDQIKLVLVHHLKEVGIQVKVTTEPVPLTKLRRVMVISQQFAKMRQSERQDLVWRIVTESLTYEQRLRISMIVTLTPNELAGR
jgi:acid stress-induced BolA-like protein IbaG/YrbA